MLPRFRTPGFLNISSDSCMLDIMQIKLKTIKLILFKVRHSCLQPKVELRIPTKYRFQKSKYQQFVSKLKQIAVTYISRFPTLALAWILAQSRCEFRKASENGQKFQVCICYASLGNLGVFFEFRYYL